MSAREEQEAARTTRVAWIRGPPWLRLPILTLGHWGSHFVWSILNARAALFLMRLGIPKSVTSVVLMAGPLSGLLVQPVVGILSDHCTSRWGRRRPYILGGLVLCLAALLCLAIATNIARIHSTVSSLLAIVLAIVGIVSIDVSVNTLSAAHRALLLDMLPADEQDLANAWATRFSSLGSVSGYLMGDMDLSNGLDLDQLSVLTLSAAVLLVLTHLGLFVLIDEPLAHDVPPNAPTSLYGRVRDLLLHFYETSRVLPPAVWGLFRIQFFVWLAWFPVLYYSSAWVAEIYRAAHHLPGNRLTEVARREGSFALLCNALTALVASILLPFCLHGVLPGASSGPHRYARAPTTVWSADDEEETADDAKAGDRKPRENAEAPVEAAAPRTEARTSAAGRWGALRAPTLPEAWLASQVLFCVSMLFFTCPIYDRASVPGAVGLISVLGLSWAMTLWAPYALLGILLRTQRVVVPHARPEALALAPQEEGADAPTRTSADAAADAEATPLHALAGTVMGLHNWSIVLPQLLTSLLSSLCTWLADPVFSVPSLVWDAPTAAAFDSTGLLFRVSSVCTLLAALHTARWIRAHDSPAGGGGSSVM